MGALTPEILLRAYAVGLFPMAETADDPDVFWVDPEHRGVLPLDGFHLPRRLARRIRNNPFAVTVDTDFAAVMAACAERTADRRETWINGQIRDLYGRLIDGSLGVTGRLQVQEGIVHLVAAQLWIPRLSRPVAGADSRDFH